MLTSSDRTTEAEFTGKLPPGVSLHATRMLLEDGIVDPETLSKMADDAERCARLLQTTDVDVIAYVCTTGSLLEGNGYAREIESRISEIADVPTVATAASVTRAFDALDVESLVIATPYTERLVELERSFLEGAGYDVNRIEGLGHETDAAIAQQSPGLTYRHARSLDRPDADAVFISCTGTRTFEAIEPLEKDLQKPVITSNQATLWDALRTMGIDYSDIELGSLFEH